MPTQSLTESWMKSLIQLSFLSIQYKAAVCQWLAYVSIVDPGSHVPAQEIVLHITSQETFIYGQSQVTLSPMLSVNIVNLSLPAAGCSLIFNRHMTVAKKCIYQNDYYSRDISTWKLQTLWIIVKILSLWHAYTYNFTPGCLLESRKALINRWPTSHPCTSKAVVTNVL